VTRNDRLLKSGVLSLIFLDENLNFTKILHQAIQCQNWNL